ncbi:uracil-DNA glycosylase family protein [Siculibacillus lacustris]|nr:uracil-DNA glycosylase family protein [Siculibacillus lacustris]
MKDKANRLAALAAKRHASPYDGYSNVCQIEPRYDGPYVSPWSKSAHNEDADVMIIGQDWSSEDRLKLPFNQNIAYLGHDPNFKTNISLFRLLGCHFNIDFEQTYATNLFVFIKTGKTSKPIPTKDMRRSAREFTIPMLEIIRPKIAICLGNYTLNALRFAAGYRSVKWSSYLDNISSNPICQIAGVAIVGVSHPGHYGTISAKAYGGLDVQWAAAAALLRKLRG